MAAAMVCNYKKCRKGLSSTAWVTSCSHAFCEEHGNNEFSRRPLEAHQCPACNTQLTDKFDVVQVNLNPPEAFKSIVLAGMKPDVVMDIAMRAISFWSYQIDEETRYQEGIGKLARDRLKALEEAHTLNIKKIKAELQNNKSKIESLQEEYNKQKRQAEEYAAKLEEKNRKIQKLQYQLDCQKRNSFHINNNEDLEENGNHNLAQMMTKRYDDQMSPQFVFQPNAKRNQDQLLMSDDEMSISSEKDFLFRPMTKSKNN